MKGEIIYIREDKSNPGYKHFYVQMDPVKKSDGKAFVEESDFVIIDFYLSDKEIHDADVLVTGGVDQSDFFYEEMIFNHYFVAGPEYIGRYKNSRYYERVLKPEEKEEILKEGGEDALARKENELEK